MTSANTMQLYELKKKTNLVGYLLLVFFGAVGVHRFYLNSIPIGLVILASTIAAGFVPPMIIVTLIIVAIDLFLIPSIVMERNLETALALGIEDPEAKQ